ncbi:lipoate--protein ligase [Erysipelothrix sp. HDW6C]|uniref:lipoate--protein ligase n=1 Tax=Erysipelothrix sp. HDW6C TaxID=2714930 RepID=UPI00140BFBFB|nr:lipoate--protein ligase [Erysipelothrix sp. HDW6C]QIK70508.1 lipoate--protein ligase [Erysipelothrix sp. HDW6C]
MRYLKNPSTNPYFNLALDEYAMKSIECDEDFFFLWQNEPSVIIGKNQNTAEEINQGFIDERGIKVARRVSGGGAVYHDFGNLNFTFVINVDDPGKVNYKKYVQPIIDALASMGVSAEASGRNDILLDGLKISGNAQRMANGKLMHHGTLMFDVNVEDLVDALNVSPDKITSKGVKSVRSRVTNIKEHLPEGTTLQDFWDSLQYYLSNEGKDAEIVLTDADLAKIEYEAVNRFGTWDWIYGYSPEFNLKNSNRFPGGKVELLMDVNEGRIQSVRFIGDYLGVEDVAEVEARLQGVRFHRADVAAVLSGLELKKYFGMITQEELLSLMFD